MMRPFFILTILVVQTSMPIFQFNADSNIDSWRILDDVVMGGRSNGEFKINNDGLGEYTGDVSLENNGGFSSLRYYFDTVDSQDYLLQSVSLPDIMNRIGMQDFFHIYRACSNSGNVISD